VQYQLHFLEAVSSQLLRQTQFEFKPIIAR